MKNSSLDPESIIAAFPRLRDAVDALRDAYYLWEVAPSKQARELAAYVEHCVAFHAWRVPGVDNRAVTIRLRNAMAESAHKMARESRFGYRK